ncbi:hypothetical protein MNEG_14454, partial [Monoraphidium neglectum]
MLRTQSLAAFDAQLDATILHQTAAVDAFLASRAVSWAADAQSALERLSQRDATAALGLGDLRHAYAWDMRQPTWCKFAGAQPSSSQQQQQQQSSHPEIEVEEAPAPAGATGSRAGASAGGTPEPARVM